jgi:hypothetical protein
MMITSDGVAGGSGEGISARHDAEDGAMMITSEGVAGVFICSCIKRVKVEGTTKSVTPRK